MTFDAYFYNAECASDLGKTAVQAGTLLRRFPEIANSACINESIEIDFIGQLFVRKLDEKRSI
jgi:hypothetical protein